MTEEQILYNAAKNQILLKIIKPWGHYYSLDGEQAILFSSGYDPYSNPIEWEIIGEL